MADLSTLQVDAAKLRKARLRRGLSMREAAAELGISYQYLSMIERGGRNVPSEVLLKMCALYRIRDPRRLANDPSLFLAVA